MSTKRAECERFSRQKLPFEKGTVPVYITYVKSPSALSVQLISQSTTGALEYLQEDISNFYNSPSGEECAFDSTLEIGQVNARGGGCNVGFIYTTRTLA